MRLICPSCGAIHSVEAWKNDMDMRQTLQMVAVLPRDVSRLALQYLSLFRAGERGLRWAKVLRLLTELQAELDKSHIQWGGKVARPNSHRAWGLAMEKVLERADSGKIRLPLESHGYLKSICYEICDEMDRKGEIERNNDPLTLTLSRRGRGDNAGEGEIDMEDAEYQEKAIVYQQNNNEKRELTPEMKHIMEAFLNGLGLENEQTEEDIEQKRKLALEQAKMLRRNYG